MVVCPLPDDDMTGLITQGRPVCSTAALTFVAHGLPAGSTLRVIQTKVHGNRTVTTPPAHVLDRAFAASSLTSGQVNLGVSNVRSYVRTEVLNSAGVRIAFSNPLWLTPAV